MKISLFAISATVGLALASPAASDPPSRYAAWESQLRDRVNDLLFYPQAANGAAGDVLVGFKVGADGRPTDINVRKSSGQAIFDRQAIILVSRLGRLGSVPANGGAGEIVLKLSYGDPSSTMAQSIQLAKDDLDEQRRNEQRARAMVASEVRVAQSGK